MHGIEGEPGALIDACIYIHLATTDDLHMQFDIVIIKHREQNMYSSVSVYKQQKLVTYIRSYIHSGSCIIIIIMTILVDWLCCGYTKLIVMLNM